MVYNFNYPTEWRDGILIKCNECKLSILKKIDSGDKISFNEKFRDSVLHFIIQFIHCSQPSYSEYPERSRKCVTNELLRHGQFNKQEIDSIYENQKGTDYTREWDEKLRESGINDEEIVSYTCYGGDSPFFEKIHSVAEPITYFFSFFPCITLKEYHLCHQNLEEFECQKCGFQVLNAKENVDGYYNLICPFCENIVKRSDLPLHHGHWDKKPIASVSNTDYITIIHHDCPDSENGMGIMSPKGIWVEDSRLIVNFKCDSCGHENVLKFFITSDNSPISVYSNSESGNPVKLKEIKYRVFDLLEEKEGDFVEFKCSFYGIVNGNPPERRQKRLANKQVINTISSFLNTNGGTLVIGIDDESGDIIGISEDLKYASPESRTNLDPEDYYLLHLKDALQNYLHNPEIAIPNVNFYLETIPTGETVCIIDVQKSNNPVFTSDKSLFVRLSNSKKELKESAAENYVKEMFDLEIDISSL